MCRKLNVRFFAKGPNYQTKATLISQLILDDGVHIALLIQGTILYSRAARVCGLVLIFVPN